MTRFLKRVWYILGLSFLLLSILILLSVGCRLKYQDINEKESLKTNDAEITKGVLCIDSDLGFYSPAMSSFPGLPLKGRFKSDSIIQNVRYHWITEYGSFLSWDDEGVIRELGNDFFNSGEKVYWSPGPFEQDDVNKEFEITLKLEDSTGINVLSEAIILIRITEDGFLINDSES
jgi:hypothetical protein